MLKQKITITILILVLGLFAFGCSKNKDTASDTSPTEQNTVTGAVLVNLMPVSKNVKTEELAKVAINLNTNNTRVNTAQIVVNYDADILEYDSISTVSSAFSIWIKKEGTEGVVNLVSAEPNPGVEGPDAYVGTIVFKAKKAGTAQITLDQSLSKMITSDETDMIRSEGHANTEIVVN